MKRTAIIMAGGSGERFWPESRRSRPKHLCDITEAGACLLEQSLRRISRVVDPENIFIITNQEQVSEIRAACPSMEASRIIAEPCRRDTLAAVGLAALCAELSSGKEDSSIVILPADHVIKDTEGFATTVRRAFSAAESGNHLVTIGIKPTYPATGYGYIRSSGEPDGNDAISVEKFHEKPQLETAKNYFAQSGFYWNAGMFFWKTSSIKKALREHVPACAEVFEEIARECRAGTPLAQVLAMHYSRIEKKSVDFALMEKAKNVKVVPAQFDWDDVGTWSAIGRHFEQDADGNVFRGNVFHEDARGNIVVSHDEDNASHAIALFGAENLIVVRTRDATLICSRDRADELKKLVGKLPETLR